MHGDFVQLGGQAAPPPDALRPRDPLPQGLGDRPGLVSPVSAASSAASSSAGRFRTFRAIGTLCVASCVVGIPVRFVHQIRTADWR